jgi:hypothetical protein
MFCEKDCSLCRGEDLVTSKFPDGNFSRRKVAWRPRRFTRRKVAWRPRRFTRPRLGMLAFASQNSHKPAPFKSSRLACRCEASKPNSLCSLCRGEDLVTSKFPDGNFSRPRLGMLAFASQNSHKPAPFKSSRLACRCEASKPNSLCSLCRGEDLNLQGLLH